MSLHEDAIYNLIFDFYEVRITLGYYNYGDYLPAIPKISDIFHMSTITVRAALSMLEEKGYIRMKAKRPAMVVYRADQAAYRKQFAHYFVPRIEGIMDVRASNDILFGPICEEVIRNLDEETSAHLWEELNLTDEKGLPATLQFYSLAFRTLGNALLLNLFWEIIRYTHFPYLIDLEARNMNVSADKQGTQNAAILQVRDGFEHTFESEIQQLADFCNKAKTEYSMENVKTIPFSWTIYHQRPQTCYSLASLIIRKIRLAEYPVGSYLPSLPRMAGDLEVSERTLRRAISILCSLGVTHSYQGKGTLVCEQVEHIEFDRPEIKEGLRLYLESLQLLELTIRQVSAYTVKAVAKEERNKLTQRFTCIWQEGRSDLCFEVMFCFITEKCPRKLVRECYCKLLELLTWGHSFALYRLSNRRLQREYAEFVRRISDRLEKEEWDGFAAEWEALIRQEVQDARNFLTKYYTP